jgi:hypothetical protein
MGGCRSWLPGRGDPAAAVTDIRTLGEVAARTTVLTVACPRCELSGRYRRDTLIARLGVDAPVRVIVPKPTADCLQRDAAALMERCDILFPDLPRCRAPVGGTLPIAGFVVTGSLILHCDSEGNASDNKPSHSSRQTYVAP